LQRPPAEKMAPREKRPRRNGGKKKRLTSKAIGGGKRSRLSHGGRGWGDQKRWNLQGRHLPPESVSEGGGPSKNRSLLGTRIHLKKGKRLELQKERERKRRDFCRFALKGGPSAATVRAGTHHTKDHFRGTAEGESWGGHIRVPVVEPGYFQRT